MEPVFRGVELREIAGLDPDDSAEAERLGKKSAVYDHVRIRERRPPAPKPEPRRIPAHLADYLRRALKARADGEPPPDLNELPGLPEINLAILLPPETRARGLLEYRATGSVPDAVFRGVLTTNGGFWMWDPSPSDVDPPESYPRSREFGENRIRWPPPTGPEAESLWARGAEVILRLAARMLGLPDERTRMATANDSAYRSDKLIFIRTGEAESDLRQRLLDRVAGRTADPAPAPEPELREKFRMARGNRG